MWERVPPPVRRVVEQLAEAGYEAALVGGCVRSLARGLPVNDWDVATSAGPEEVLRLFPRAVPIGLRFGTVMVPTPAGPVDVTRFRGAGGLEADLAQRDFTINAVALRAGQRAVLDPFGGIRDLEAGRLRAVGAAAERMAEDPLRALRAARFVAELSLTPDPEVVAAMSAVVPRLAGVAAERIRAELEQLLLGPEAGRGIGLLRDTGIEAALLPGARADAGAVVAALPARRTVRLAGWLRGTKVAALLRRIRVSRARARNVELLISLHPVEESCRPRPGDVRRLLRRAGDAQLERLFALRRAEIAVGSAPPGADARLRELEASVERIRSAGTLALSRSDLALDGRAVMELLGCGPGPRVGRALQHLTECILDDPACNTPERLRRIVEAWAEKEPDGPRAPGRRSER